MLTVTRVPNVLGAIAPPSGVVSRTRSGNCASEKTCVSGPVITCSTMAPCELLTAGGAAGTAELDATTASGGMTGAPADVWSGAGTKCWVVVVAPVRRVLMPGGGGTETGAREERRDNRLLLLLLLLCADCSSGDCMRVDVAHTGC